MICLNCGREIENDSRICPYCGSFVDPVDDSDFLDADLPEYEENYAESADEEYYEEADDEEYASDDFTDDDPVRGTGKRGLKMSKIKKPEIKIKAPAVSGKVSLPAVLSAISCILSLICLLSVLSLKSALWQSTEQLRVDVSTVQSTLGLIDERLSGMDTTIAGVQTQAYNQLASQSINITKDITALTGPVTSGKYNVMFIINAKGNLSISSSFDWQRYNQATGGWESIVFSGNATTNEQYGLRIANSYNKTDNYYVSELWANGITSDAAGTYRCVITDATGIVKNSAEATVQVSNG